MSKVSKILWLSEDQIEKIVKYSINKNINIGIIEDSVCVAGEVSILENTINKSDNIEKTTEIKIPFIKKGRGKKSIYETEDEEKRKLLENYKRTKRIDEMTRDEKSIYMQAMRYQRNVKILNGKIKKEEL